MFAVPRLFRAALFWGLLSGLWTPATLGQLPSQLPAQLPAQAPAPLADVAPLTLQGDIASQMVAGIDRFLLRKTDQAAAARAAAWEPDQPATENFSETLQRHRQQLSELLGIVDPRLASDSPERQAVLWEAAGGPSITRVRWPVLEDPDPHRSLASVHGTGILLEPAGEEPPLADVIFVPDADLPAANQTQGPAWLVDPAGIPQQLLRCRCRVLIPVVIDRREQDRRGRKLTNREYVYRPGFELGRHVIGYEVHKLLAAVDWLQSSSAAAVSAGDSPAAARPVGIVGLGEGGRLSLFAAALEPRIAAMGLCGSFGPWEQLWQEPIDRNVFGLLEHFGAAEVLSMLAPRPVWIAHGPTVDRQLDTQRGGTPGVLRSISAAESRPEIDRSRQIFANWSPAEQWDIQQTVIDSQPHAPHAAPPSPPTSAATAAAGQLLHADVGPFLKQLLGELPTPSSPPLDLPASLLPEDEWAMWQQQAVEEIDRHNQLLLRESPFVREQFFNQLNTDSLEQYQTSIEAYREIFRRQVIGHFDDPRLPANPRVRESWQTEQWTGYEVVLDVFPDVMAYGVLLLPNDLAAGQRRGVVVCQHGLEGRPTDTFLGDHPAYHDFAARLCAQGWIVFAPQNPYLFQDRFRSLQRKANPLGKTLFSIIVPQHQQIVDWLQTLPMVDPQRIAFYGLSYGGKSAMRIPALVTDYSLSICSADFNEWVVKNASTRDKFSYVWTGEYEIFEWNLGNTFNYAEMAALICPRPFMVERGHFDGVGSDAWVAYEYAKVRRLYAAQLNIGQRTEIEWFVGPHTINGQGTFAFLERQLGPPR